MKIMTLLAMTATVLMLTAPAMAMGNKPSTPDSGSSGGTQSSGSTQSSDNGQGGGGSGGGGGEDGGDVLDTANDVVGNDAVQQGGEIIGDAIAKGGQSLVNQAYQYGNQGVPYDKVKQMAQTGTNIYAAGQTLKTASQAGDHVGWVATSAGYAAEGQYKGAAIQAVNGVSRTVTVSAIGGAATTAATTWAAGKLGALAGSWAGPLGAGAGFIIGCGAAYIGGKIWDKTIGQGADALTQKAADYDAQSQYGGTSQTGGKPGMTDFDGQTVAGETRDIGRDNAQQQVRDNIRTSRPSGGGGGGSGGCGGSCGR